MLNYEYQNELIKWLIDWLSDDWLPDLTDSLVIGQQKLIQVQSALAYWPNKRLNQTINQLIDRQIDNGFIDSFTN